MAQITTYEITNNNGDSISIANFGARLIRWDTRVNDESRNIILGYSTVEDYLTDPSYLGAIVGPYANRIGNARCTIAKKDITLLANEGANQLHGGENAFAHQYWQCINHDKNTLTLRCQLPDGYNGYPGNISFQVTYELALNNELDNELNSELTITMEISSSATTIAGPTSHPYFNLNVEQKSPVHSLQVCGEHYTPVDKQGIPVGELSLVQGTNFDYREMKKIDNALQPLDNNFLVALTDTTTATTLFKHASLRSEDQALTLNAYSNYPAVQVYSGEFLNEPFPAFSGICLEPQFCPDSPNQPNFPFHLTSKDKPLTTVITYQLAKA